MTSATLVELPLRSEEDVFGARQLGRACGLGLGLERLDALRVATAISELGREIVIAGGGQLTVSVPGTVLALELSADRPPRSWPATLTAVNRLVDRVAGPAETGSGVRVRLEKALPVPLGRAEIATLREELVAQHRASPADQLREQNRELLSALEDLRAQRAELEKVNRELEETNRGVLAMYGELSAELDRTNQGVVALYAEIDDKNRQLHEASEAKSRFLRSVSHELRTPVNSILGLTGLLLDPRQPERLSREHMEQVEFIRTSAGDLQRLVEELLDLSKAESGRLQPEMSTVSLPRLFDELRRVIEPLLRPGVAFHTEVTGVDEIVTDPDLVRHVLRNLLSNAAKFTPAGRVTLSATAEDEAVVLAVRDTGVGIAPEDRTRVFEEFFQATSPLHARAKGTGLGLPFAQVVAGALGGHIELESTVGEGSCFSFRLPTGGVPPSPSLPDHQEAGGGRDA